MNNPTKRFLILLSLVALAGLTLFLVRQGTLRQLNSERLRIEQEIAEWQDRQAARPPAAAARSVSANAALSDAEYSELLRLRGEIGVLRRDLAEQTKQPAVLTSTELVRATNGVPPPPQADVTALIRTFVAGGTNRITPGNDVFGDDPAPGVIKRLRVEFSLGGQPGTNETTEGGSLEIPAGAEVVRAVYGDFPALDPGKEIMDVTAEILARVGNGETSVKAANALVGFDPAPMFGKMLRVELSVGGTPLVLEANEGRSLDIPAGAQIVHAAYGNLSGQKRSPPQ